MHTCLSMAMHGCNKPTNFAVLSFTCAALGAAGRTQGVTAALALPTVLGQCWVRAARQSVVAVVRVRAGCQCSAKACCTECAMQLAALCARAFLQVHVCWHVLIDGCADATDLLHCSLFGCALPAQVMEEKTAR